MENQIEKKIKVLRTHNGGELYKKEFEELSKKCGIAQQKNTPYTSQKNGFKKRMDMILIEKVRIMLNGFTLGEELWVDAVETSCYLVNTSPSSTLEDKNPHEVWTRMKPALANMRASSYDAYVHVPKEKITNFDSKFERCTFIG